MAGEHTPNNKSGDRIAFAITVALVFLAVAVALLSGKTH